jgi:hypothetical protein
MTIASEPKVFSVVEAKGVSIDPAMLGAMPSWTGGRSATAAHVNRLKLADVKLTGPESDFKALNGDILFEPNGTVKQATLTNEKLKLEISPHQSGLRVILNARDWRPPFGPPIAFSYLTLDGIADKQHFGTTDLSGRIGGGSLTGTFAARWDGPMVAGGEFKLQGARIDDAIATIAPDFKMRGILSANARYAMQADAATGVPGKSMVEGTFAITRGEFSNIDLVRALQSQGNALHGGRTAFEELTGSVQITGDQYSYRQLQLSSGPLNAKGHVDVARNGQLSGRVDADMEARGSVLGRSSFRLSGTVKDPQLVR